MKKLVLLFLAAGVITISGCETMQPVAQKTQLEIREFQTRTYDQSNTKMVMKAVMNALQDDGFIVQQANIDLGLLTAQKEEDVENSAESFFARAFTNQPEYRKNSITEASANISEYGKQTKVRINFKNKVMNNRGAVMSVTQISDEKFYQNFFATVDKSLFLAKAKIQ
ncbi:MAG: hypothetical protein FDX21_00230 [Chlorobium sp.]|nr:MAG: hypothetical protein FDX21_00230 [Chlorobium sp.]